MSERPDDMEMQIALRDGLHRLPVPVLSAAEFDAQVLTALHTQQPWWMSLWHSAQPVLVSTACSSALMLAAIFWTLHSPSAPQTAGSVPTLSRPVDMAALDALLDRPDPSAASLIELTMPSAPAPKADDRHMPPPPKRRAAGLHVPMIV